MKTKSVPKPVPATKAKEKSVSKSQAIPVVKKLLASRKSTAAPVVSKKVVKATSKVVETSASARKASAKKSQNSSKPSPAGKVVKVSVESAAGPKSASKSAAKPQGKSLPSKKAVPAAAVKSTSTMSASSTAGSTGAKASKSKSIDPKATKITPVAKGKAPVAAAIEPKKTIAKKMGMLTAGAKTNAAAGVNDDEKEILPVINNGPPTDPKILAKIRSMQSDQEKRKDFAQPPTAKPVLVHSSKLFDQAKDPAKDRLILMVRDPFWLHACWDITRKSVERAKASLAGHWHAAKPILRLLRTEDNSTTSNSESVFRDIPIHGGVRNWYIDVEDSQTTFRILLGYMFGNGRFHELARSNPVTTPVPGSADATDDHWADIATDAERVYALSGGYDEESTHVELQQMMQEKLKRPIGTPAMSQFGSGAEGSLKRSKNFHFTLDAEMVVFGATPANAYVTLNGEPIKIRGDGTYSARVPLPNNRQVMAATSKSRDGLDEQTIVIAVERNTKIMEPLSLTEPDLD
ncbi:MAG: DUF4912 domain-containing protein [Planctomycetota bacterium]|nr:DUF4912 domain-containing protein [Planctomycetota bacterium]